MARIPGYLVSGAFDRETGAVERSPPDVRSGPGNEPGRLLDEGRNRASCPGTRGLASVYHSRPCGALSIRPARVISGKVGD